MSPDEYCREKAARSGSSFYYSFLFLSPEQRRAITALYAFCREVDDVVDECREAHVARAKLQWWREETARLFAGDPQHPATRALSGPIRRYNLPEEYFREIIDGMEMDLDQPLHASFKDLALYCYRAAGVVGLLSAEIFGYEDRRTLKYAQALGTAFQLTNIIRDVREDARRGRVYIPQDELMQFGVKPEDLLQPVTTERVRALLEFQAERARGYYKQAFDLLPEQDRHRQRSGLAMAAIYQATLDEIARDGYRVLEHSLTLTPLRKLWIAWRAVRKASKSKVESRKSKA